MVWNDLLAIISTGSLGTLLVTDEVQRVLIIILALAQIVTVAKPYLPFQNRSFQKGSDDSRMLGTCKTKI